MGEVLHASTVAPWERLGLVCLHLSRVDQLPRSTHAQAIQTGPREGIPVVRRPGQGQEGVHARFGRARKEGEGQQKMGGTRKGYLADGRKWA